MVDGWCIASEQQCVGASNRTRNSMTRWHRAYATTPTVQEVRGWPTLVSYKRSRGRYMSCNGLRMSRSAV